MHNRGKQSSDDKWFAPKWHPILKKTVDDLCYLLSRGYAEKSGLQVVGNHYKLNKRQRNAIRRISCSDQEILARQHSNHQPNELENKTIDIDGFNTLILLESALSGAYIFKGRDGNYRDISGVHGSYKRVKKTENAILLVRKTLSELKVKSIKWYLDQPVSNSGRLKMQLLDIGRRNNSNWDVEVVYDPDKILAESKSIVITSDGWILDRAQKWFNLGAYLMEKYIKEANVIVV